MSFLEDLTRQSIGDFPNTPSHPAHLQSTPILLSPSAKIHPNEPPISDKLYAGFIEHVGRCIYGGIVDNPAHPSPEKLLLPQSSGNVGGGRLGWRKDVLEELGKEGELEIPMLRWPGGNFVSNYHWQDGIGPIDQRPKRIELAWLSTESNIFGTDEFIDYCRGAKCEPFICLNMGSGTFEEALAWLEYCNGTGDTHWANLRRKNTGRDEPHNVKYWGLGNESVGNLTATEYGQMAKRWAHGLRLVDPSIKLISCGNTGSTDWDREVLQAMIGFADLHSIHFYSMLGHDKFSNVPGLEYEKNVFGPAFAEKNIEICKSLIDLANIITSYRKIPAREVKICFDEWNVWDETKAPGSANLEQTYDYTDMLAFCAWLNLLVRKHKDIGIACLAQSVNVIAPIMTRPDGLIHQTIYHPLRLFSKYMKNGSLIHLPSMPDVYTGPTFPVVIQQIEMKPAYIDCVAVYVKDTGNGSSIRLSVLNRHPSADWTAACTFDGFKLEKVTISEIYSDDLDATNTFDHPNVIEPSTRVLSSSEWEDQKASQIVRKHSWTFFMFDGVEI